MDDDLLAGADTIAVCAPDNSGRLIGKRIPASRWAAVLADGLPMPNFHLITGIENIPLEGLTVTGPHRGFPNGILRPCPQTMCRPPWEAGTALVLSDVANAAGEAVEEAPRSVLRRQLAQLENAGLTATFASELEFYLFRTSYREAWASGYRVLEPSHHLHADNDILIAGYDQEFGLSATFMAKPFTDQAGSSCHVHLCLYARDGRPVLGVEELSTVGRSFLAGLLAYSPELTLLHAQYANSYRRLQPGSFAPVNATWGWDNRTCMVRVIGRGRACRFEFKIPGADANPYLSFAAILAAGLGGIAEQLDPPDPVSGNASIQNAAPRLPADLTEAVAGFANSKLASRAFTSPVHQHLLGLAKAELNATRRHVTDWETRRGFENA